MIPKRRKGARRTKGKQRHHALILYIEDSILFMPLFLFRMKYTKGGRWKCTQKEEEDSFR
jgi:hypothetical protein